MVKKINSDAIAIKALIKQGIKPINIAQILGFRSKKLITGGKLPSRRCKIGERSYKKIILKKFDFIWNCWSSLGSESDDGRLYDCVA